MKKVIFLVVMCLMVMMMNAQTFEYVDLGLPSGTKWKSSNEEELLTYKEAVCRFGDKLPTIEQWRELMGICDWTWMGNGVGYKVTGPNGNSITLPAAGFRQLGKSVNSVGTRGRYWLSTSTGSDVWHLYFTSGSVRTYGDYGGYTRISVRLVQD